MSQIEDGTYRARAMPGTAQLGYTSKGTEQVVVGFEFQDAPHKGQKIAWYGYFSEATAERTIESLRFCGWTGDDLFDLSTVGSPESSDVDIVIESEEDEQGKRRTRVRWVNRRGIGMALKEKMNEQQARDFAKRMKGAVLAQKQKSGTPKSNASRPIGGNPNEAPPHTDDDLGF